MRKTGYVLLIVLFLYLVCLIPANAYEVQYGFAAEELWQKGLFLGSNGTFNLDQPLTRVEGVTMIVRLLGKESEAKEKNFAHPFSDVPSWADPYVGYCYEHKISNGISADKFGSNQEMSAAQYLTLVLRALGYSDGNGKDFLWNESPSKALEIGLIGESCHKQYTTTNLFLRDNAAVIAYNALYLNKKGSDRTLEASITLPGKPSGAMPSYTKSGASGPAPGKQETNTGTTSGAERITLKNGHNNNNLILSYQYTAGMIYAAQRYATMETGSYSGPLEITFMSSDGNDIRSITVEANSTYAITYTYLVKEEKGMTIKQPDQKIPIGIDPVTGLQKYTTIPGTVTTIPAVSHDIKLDILVSGGASGELSTSVSFAGSFHKGDFKMVKLTE